MTTATYTPEELAEWFAIEQAKVAEEIAAYDAGYEAEQAQIAHIAKLEHSTYFGPQS